MEHLILVVEMPRVGAEAMHGRVDVFGLILAEAVRCGAEIYAALRKRVVERFGTAGVGDEGGFAPDLSTPEEALDLLMDAIGAAGYRAGAEVELALDPAATPRAPTTLATAP